MTAADVWPDRTAPDVSRAAAAIVIFAAQLVDAVLDHFVVATDPRTREERLDDVADRGRRALARRRGGDERRTAHRHRLTRAERRFKARTRLSWRVALAAMRFGTPRAQITYRRAVRIVRFVRRALRAGSRVRSLGDVLRRAVARATPWASKRRDRWARRKLSRTDAWHDYRRAWRRSHGHPGAATPRAVLANPRIHLTSLQRADVAAGRVDRRILALMQALSARWVISISSLKSDHGRCVNSNDFPGCAVSNHYMGRAMDIGTVNGAPVTIHNRAGREVFEYLRDRAPGPIHPTELISPWADDGHHDDHIHVGFDF